MSFHVNRYIPNLFATRPFSGAWAVAEWMLGMCLQVISELMSLSGKFSQRSVFSIILKVVYMKHQTICFWRSSLFQSLYLSKPGRIKLQESWMKFCFSEFPWRCRALVVKAFLQWKLNYKDRWSTALTHWKCTPPVWNSQEWNRKLLVVTCAKPQSTQGGGVGEKQSCQLLHTHKRLTDKHFCL